MVPPPPILRVKEKTMMKKNRLAVSTLGVLLVCATAMAGGPNFSVPLNDPSDVAAIKQVQRDIGDAMVAVDIDKLNQIFADGWSTTGISGKVVTKEKVLRDFKSGADKLVAYELGPLDVQVLGNFAVAHGTVIEQRLRDGKDASGQSVFMDLMEKRAGKWVVVRSSGASIKQATPSN